MVFLSVWALFGVGSLVGSKRGVVTDNRIRVGRVLSGVVNSVEDNTSLPIPSTIPEPLATHEDILSKPPVSYNDLYFEREVTSTRSDEHDDNDGPSTDYIIGRISAWICTTLYLTSRLPQIWKNVSIEH